MLVMWVSVWASSAATPSWYPSLQRAVVDAGDAGAAVGARVMPHAATSKAGRACAVARASDDAGVLDNVSFFAETGAKVGPCTRLLHELDHTTTGAAARALAFANNPPTTMAKDVSGRRALERAATHVTDDFAALQHCLGNS